MKALLFLFFSINLINYFDRGLISSFNNNFITDFNITKTQSGIINSSFIIGYILLSPLFSFLVYKYNKINLIFIGLVIWCVSNLCAFFSNYNYYFFIISRIFVGAGEASFGTIAPAIIDSKSKLKKKSTNLSVYFLAIPLGYALGYIIGGTIQKYINWHYGFLIESSLMILCSFFLFCFKKKFENKETLLNIEEDFNPYSINIDNVKTDFMSFCSKIKYIFKQKDYFFTVISYSFYTFVIGAYSYWGPVYLIENYDVRQDISSYIFGGISLVTGILGSFLGGYLLDKFKNKFSIEDNKVLNIKIALKICLYSLILSLIFCLIIFNVHNKYAFFIIFFFAQLFLFIITGPINSILLWSVEDKENITEKLNAELKTLSCSFSILFIHLIGDIPSPILTGFIEDRLNNWSYTMTIITSFLSISCIMLISLLYILKKKVYNQEKISDMYYDL